MRALYIGSTAGNSGKSMITMGLGLRLEGAVAVDARLALRAGAGGRGLGIED